MTDLLYLIFSLFRRVFPKDVLSPMDHTRTDSASFAHRDGCEILMPSL